jgi:hypothetical protein
MITKVNLVKRCSMSIEVFAKRARELRNGKGLTTRMLGVQSIDNNPKTFGTVTRQMKQLKFMIVGIGRIRGVIRLRP